MGPQAFLLPDSATVTSHVSPHVTGQARPRWGFSCCCQLDLQPEPGDCPPPPPWGLLTEGISPGGPAPPVPPGRTWGPPEGVRPRSPERLSPGMEEASGLRLWLENEPGACPVGASPARAACTFVTFLLDGVWGCGPGLVLIWGGVSSVVGRRAAPSGEPSWPAPRRRGRLPRVAR